MGAQGAALSDAPSGLRASVVVCTRNRGAELAATVGALAAQRASCEWEILVVDNASTDSTTAVARRAAAEHGRRVRVVDEPTVGLAAARNCGLRQTRGDLVVFLDDDAEPVPGWLDAYVDALAGPDVLAAGGPVEPRFDSPLPDWLVSRYLPYLSVWDRGESPHDLVYNELPRGTNMAFRREAFARVGEFDRRLGRSGGSLRSCEETELGLRLERAGARIVYVPAARVLHRVAASRLTPEWLVARFAAQAFSEAIVDWKHFGRAGLRRGSTAARRAVEAASSAAADGGLNLRLARAARRAYRFGAMYAAIRVERWNPPRSAGSADDKSSS